MRLPFTQDEFFAIFAQYNRVFAVAAVMWWLAAVALLVLARRNPPRHGGTLSLFLGALWLWNAVAYHALFFTRINPAAWPFAAMFAVQAVLFFRAAAGRRLDYLSSAGWSHTAGLALIAYALLYPFLTIALGHPYPATPTFGVPCPTALLTIGLLLTVRTSIPVALAIVPVLWGFIGGSAAVLLAVATDYVLPGAGLLLTWRLWRQRALRPSGFSGASRA